MQRPNARTLTLRAGAWVAALLLVSSCSKKHLANMPYPDVMGTVTTSAQLIVYPDVPLTTYVFSDTADASTGHRAVCSDDDELIGTFVERSTTTNTVHGFIFDFTPADAYQVFRLEGSGYRLLKDYPLQPVKRYPLGNADVFLFDDPSATPAAFQDYVARGITAGAITPTSPLSEVGHITTTPTASILYTGRTNICGDIPGSGEAPPDSLLPMSWTSVPGAAWYWVQIFQYGTGADVLASRFPAPAFVGRTVDYFLALFPGTVTSYKIGDPLPPGTHLLTQKTLLNNTDYAVRITAVNSDGELIAYPSEASRDYLQIKDPHVETHYSLRTLGAFVVHTGTPSTCPPNPPCGQAVGTALPNVKVFSPLGLPPALR
jgi:hypothetical protein